METMQHGGFSAIAGAAIYDECSIMWHGFDSVMIQHCGRDSNCVAHELARVAFCNKESGGGCNFVSKLIKFGRWLLFKRKTETVERINELHHREERSRIQWLAFGEKNTRLFQMRASRRRKRNKIIRFMKPDGQITMNEHKMSQLTTGFYRDLYCSQGMTNMETVLATVPTKVSVEMNNSLLFPGGKSGSVPAMFPMKTPGPDRYLAYFFQRQWLLERGDGRRPTCTVRGGRPDCDQGHFL